MEHVNNITSKADMERLKLDNYQPITVTAGDPITIHAAGGISVEKFAENIKGSLALSIKKESNVKIKIKDVNIIVENKVVEVTFSDGDKQKSVCRARCVQFRDGNFYLYHKTCTWWKQFI